MEAMSYEEELQYLERRSYFIQARVNALKKHLASAEGEQCKVEGEPPALVDKPRPKPSIAPSSAGSVASSTPKSIPRPSCRKAMAPPPGPPTPRPARWSWKEGPSGP